MAEYRSTSAQESEEGAKLVIGGEGHPQGLEHGNFVKPTVFADVKPWMKISREEIFGPVLSILTYKTEAEAIEMANDFGIRPNGLCQFVQPG